MKLFFVSTPAQNRCTLSGHTGHPITDNCFMTEHHLKLSIVILNWNNKALLEKCLFSLQKHIPTTTHEIIVVDNASNDGSPTMVRSTFPNVRLIVNPKNLGYAKGNNIGIKEANGEYTLLLNEDTEFTSPIVEVLVRYLDDHTDVGAVAPRLLYPDTSTQYSCRTFPKLLPLYKQIAVDLHLLPPTKRWAEYKMNYWEHDDTKEVDQPMTTAILIRTDLLKKLGGFDEQFVNYFNDVDLCYRIKEQERQRIVFIGDHGHIIHHHGQGMKALKWKRVKFWNEGIRRFYRKHYVSSPVSVTYILLNIGLAIRTCALAARYLIEQQRKH